jgi:aminoglycoside phosphotransferase
MTLTAISLLKHIRPRNRIVLFLSKNICVKYSNTVQLSEAAALRLVAEKTTIPVPKVYCAFQNKGITYIVMQRIDGEPIGKNWEAKPESERESLLEQLKGYFDQLRAIPHPRPATIAAADMGSLYDYRLPNGSPGYGPFNDKDEFHLFLRNNVKNVDGFQDEELKLKIERLISLQDEQHHKITFTHGDASSSNYLVKEGKVVAFIDFEMAGFLPEYWEYTTAMNVNPYDEFWQKEIGKFLVSYPRELEMEDLRRQYFN